MVDTASIIVAIISLLGAVLAALFTGYTTYLADERKRQHQIQAEVRKYSDPLLVTAWDLQDRLFELLDTTITKFDRTNDNAKENLDLFTCYLLAQFLAWRYILKIKTQFLAFTEDKSTNKLKEVLEKISEELSTSRYGRNQWQFRMWPGHQLAIAENMVDLHSENGETSELHPMGWHHFRHGFDERFGFYFRWFRDSIKDLLDAKFEKEEEARKEKAGRAEKEKADGAILKMTGEPGLVKVDGAKDEKT
ncbi:hypothetical protein G6011_00321 [Alternaria panax]|uniref:Uncharacterized protein n=1 Tax=Alternaria panax TaxID=48097 RepID=A0AAD4NTH3_9PLEO|nr:hypothetical protein G6011_00321 [Alternaria panax]